MINPKWGWGHSHKGMVEKSRLALFSVYRELGWNSHKQDLILKKDDLDESDYRDLLNEVLWYLDDNGQYNTTKYEEIDKLYKYMKKHRKT